MGLADLVEKLINERGSAAILRERLQLVKEQAAVQDEKITTLETKAAELEIENAALKNKLAASQRVEEFEEHFGAAFKRKPNGDFHEALYCPIHHVPAGSIERDFPYSCSVGGCNWSSEITPATLGKAIRKITNTPNLSEQLGF